MTEQENLRLIGHDLPGRSVAEHTNLYVGVQRGREVTELVAADAESVSFDIRVEPIVDAGVLVDFRGPYVQGKRGGRFVYLNWVDVSDDGTHTARGRAKIGLENIPDDVSSAFVTGDAVTVEMGLTDMRGRPRYATIKPDDLRWRRR